MDGVHSFLREQIFKEEGDNSPSSLTKGLFHWEKGDSPADSQAGRQEPAWPVGREKTCVLLWN